MSMGDLIDQRVFVERMGLEIRNELTKAAEPEIQKALTAMEAQMRRALASWVIGQLEQSYDVTRRGHDLVITVRGHFGDGKPR